MKVVFIVLSVFMQSVFCMNLTINGIELTEGNIRSGEVRGSIEETYKKVGSSADKLKFLVGCLENVYGLYRVFPKIPKLLVDDMEKYLLKYICMIDAKREDKINVFCEDSVLFLGGAQEDQKELKTKLVELSKSYEPEDLNFVREFSIGWNKVNSMIDLFSNGDSVRDTLLGVFNAEFRLEDYEKVEKETPFCNSLMGMLFIDELNHEELTQSIIQNELIREEIMYESAIAKKDNDKDTFRDIIDEITPNEGNLIQIQKVDLDFSTWIEMCRSRTCDLMDKLLDAITCRNLLLSGDYHLNNRGLMKSELRYESVIHILIKHELIRQKGMQRKMREVLEEKTNRCNNHCFLCDIQ